MRIFLVVVCVVVAMDGGGCGSAGPRGVPGGAWVGGGGDGGGGGWGGRRGGAGGAVLVQEGGPVISFTAVNPGTIYLRDQTADRVIMEIGVNQGQRVEVDARANEVRVDDRPARA